MQISGVRCCISSADVSRKAPLAEHDLAINAASASARNSIARINAAYHGERRSVAAISGS